LPAVTTFFSRAWWWTTLLVLIGMAVLTRLGLWQLDRLEQRRAYNTQIVQQLALPPFDLTGAALPADLTTLKNRQAMVRGEYDLSRQVALTHQSWMNTPGFHLITPLIIEGEARSGNSRPTAVLVDRGWLPAAQQEAEGWSQYDVAGPQTVTGYIMLSQTLPGADDPNPAPNALQREWYRVDIADIESQMPYELLPVYLQQGPSSDAGTSLPYRSQLDADLSEGNHFSYAIQWFIFAAILGIGYVYFVGKRTRETVDSGQQGLTIEG
jgi:surfeit locus 1 family protein